LAPIGHKDKDEDRVTDQGMGISDKDKEGLFTLFFRAGNEETRSVPGTGIGLYIVKTIVDLHGGKIEAKPPPWGRSAINFYILCAYSGVIEPQQQVPVMTRATPWSRMDDQPQLLTGQEVTPLSSFDSLYRNAPYALRPGLFPSR